MRWKAYGYVRKGLSHKNGVCQDKVLLGNTICGGGFVQVELADEFLAGVADGVGGHKAGEYASGLTMLYLSQIEADRENWQQIREILADINSIVRATGKSQEAFEGMASTLTLLGVKKSGNFYMQLGNSRLYKVVNKDGDRMLVKVTDDHNNYFKWMQEGVRPEHLAGLGEEELKQCPEAFYLTSYVGMTDERFGRELDCQEVSRTDAVERFFLTSDGVHDHLNYEELQELFCDRDDPESLLKAVADKAVENGSRDDISVVLLERSEEKTDIWKAEE